MQAEHRDCALFNGPAECLYCLVDINSLDHKLKIFLFNIWADWLADRFFCPAADNMETAATVV
jgi:hypothetical protein